MNNIIINKALDKIFLNRKLKGIKKDEKKYTESKELINEHFERYSNISHPCKDTMEMAVIGLNNSPATILETGSSAWGTNSSKLFDSYVNSFGGTFDTVDIRIKPALKLRPVCSVNTNFHCNDSIKFLKKWCALNRDKKIDLIYLDSWDVNWIDPDPSQLHGLQEFLACSTNLKKGSQLLIDDSPINEEIMKKVNNNYIKNFKDYYDINGFYPGKGGLVLNLLKQLKKGQLLKHEYQILWQF
jgi:hypothetical protein